MKAILVTTTTDSKEEADRVARKLLDEHTAACVQIVAGVESRYWWKGEIETTVEWLCLIKTTEDHYGAVEAAIHEVHSYDQPEIVALPFVSGSAGYLGWIEKETSSPKDTASE